MSQLNVDVKLPLTVNFGTIPGVVKATQVFPDDPDMSHWYVVYVEESQLNNVIAILTSDPGINLVEKVPIRTIKE